MMFHTPHFWYRSPGLISQCLSPASALYDQARKLYSSRVKPQEVDIPVICVGNLTTGGSGKTPVVQSLYRFIKGYNLAQNPVILSRGYGGEKLSAPLLVTEDEMPSYNIGDEARMLARSAPVIIYPDRYYGALYAQDCRFDMIIMDDGFQNPGLVKDLSLLVIDGEKGFGNGKLLPAGPLREPVADGLSRADACIIMGEDKQGIKSLLPEGMPCLSTRIGTDFRPKRTLKYIAFCGLAHPDKFRATLAKHEIPLADFIAYPDHYNYAAADISKLLHKVKETGARLLTTEKDAARLFLYEKKLAPYMDVLHIHLQWSNKETLFNLLRETVSKGKT
jgi:tetraacyldisaccharide 4'-kinase